MTDEHVVVQALRESAAVGIVDGLVRSLAGALGTSTIAHSIALLRKRSLSRVAAQSHIGTLLMAAAVVHVAATQLNADAVGWMWLLVPVTAFVAGALMLARGRAMARQEGHTHA